MVGGGAGGLPLVSRLGKRLGKKGEIEVVLVDEDNTHVWKPRYHEVATGAIDADLDAVNYRAHARINHYHFEPGTLQSVDPDAQRVTLAPLYEDDGAEVLPERSLDYDTLVLAIGSQSNDFGIPGVQQHCYFLDLRDQVERFREHFLNTCLRANYEETPLRVAVVGAGATGVELAAEIHHAIALLKDYGHEHLDRSKLEVNLVEAAPRILPALPERVSAAAGNELEELGVRLHPGTAVKAVEAGALITDSGERLEADLLVWAAGVKAPAMLAEIPGVSCNRANQIQVDQTLRVPGFDNFYVIGDSAYLVPEGRERPIPPRAQSAQQMALRTATNIRRQLAGKRPRPFVYRDHGSLVSLSRYSSVGVLMGNLKGGNLFIEGWLARMAYISLYRVHQAALYGWPRTLLLLIAGRFNRLVRPRLKLH